MIDGDAMSQKYLTATSDKNISRKEISVKHELRG